MTGVHEIRDRLIHVFGRQKGAEVYERIMGNLGIETIAGPDDEMRFADALIGSGGLMETIGRSLRVRALLRGAQRPSAS